METTTQQVEDIVQTRPPPFYLTALGKELGVSRERIRQIFNQLGVPVWMRARVYGRHVQYFCPDCEKQVSAKGFRCAPCALGDKREVGQSYPCTRCGEPKLFPDQFYPYHHLAHGKMSSGYRHICRKCQCAGYWAWIKAEPERYARIQAKVAVHGARWRYRGYLKRFLLTHPEKEGEFMEVIKRGSVSELREVIDKYRIVDGSKRRRPETQEWLDYVGAMKDGDAAILPHPPILCPQGRATNCGIYTLRTKTKGQWQFLHMENKQLIVWIDGERPKRS